MKQKKKQRIWKTKELNEIYYGEIPARILAAKYGVSTSTIHNIRRSNAG